jgi:hypothetical protein
MFREVQAKAVKDVPAEEFIKAYAAHLKSTDKVRAEAGGRRGARARPAPGEGEAAWGASQRAAQRGGTGAA